MATAREITDKTLAEMEKHLTGIYKRAAGEVGQTWKKYLDEVDKNLSDLQAEVDAAVKGGDKAEIRKAKRRLAVRKKQDTIQNRHYQDLTNELASQMLHLNETAAAYVNGKIPQLYAINYNEVARGLNSTVRGYSFSLVDANTLKRLATKQENLLPFKKVNGKKDIRWNVKKINAEVTQGILQGESIPHIADRLEAVLGMNRSSAIRNARTTVTNAENKGRMDMLHEAQDRGIIVKKIWLATMDKRTRDAHMDLNGVEADIDEPFTNELGDIMYPGDPNAEDPANVYQCRCTLKYKVVGFKDRS